MTDKDTKEAPKAEAPKASVRNPSGASDAQIAKGERVGKAVGPDDDPTFHVYEFTDPFTGEVVEPEKQTVHKDAK